MRHVLPSPALSLVLAATVATLALAACPPAPPADGGGEGEGEAGEGEGEAGEGEGEGGEGEGEGGEGEGEGEGGEGEGEGEGGEGEGEGEGEGALGDLCGSDGDCGGGLVCGFDGSAGFLQTKCAPPPPGGLPTGSACSDGAQCERGLCLANAGTGSQCSEPCEDDGDCASTQVCANNSVTVVGIGPNGEDVGGVVRTCEPDGDLPEVPCDEDADCAPTGRICNTVTQPGGSGTDLLFVCGFPFDGGGLGATCSEAFVNTEECSTGMCDGDTNGTCTQACNSDDDCAVAFGFLCTGAPFTNVPGRVCADACNKESDCAQPGRSCQLRDNAVEDLVDLVCAEDVGPKAAGQSAAGAGECQTGFVIIAQGGGITCTQMCQSASDCTGAGALTACEGIDVETPSGEEQTVQACVTP